MQVDPIKPTLRAPGTERLKLKSEELLSNFGFRFNVRCYTVVFSHMPRDGSTGAAVHAAKTYLAGHSLKSRTLDRSIIDAAPHLTDVDSTYHVRASALLCELSPGR